MGESLLGSWHWPIPALALAVFWKSETSFYLLFVTVPSNKILEFFFNKDDSTDAN